jgi:hypothetical protein
MVIDYMKSFCARFRGIRHGEMLENEYPLSEQQQLQCQHLRKHNLAGLTRGLYYASKTHYLGRQAEMKIVPSVRLDKDPRVSRAQPTEARYTFDLICSYLIYSK